MEPKPRHSVAERIERLDALDAVAEPLQKAVGRVVPQESTLKNALSGTWLGHPLHPLLTDVVIGSWVSAWLLDVAAGKSGESAADRLVGIGVVAAAPTVAAGLSDWAELFGATRRVGVVHALGNTTALALQGLSLAARRRGARAVGVALSTLGMAVATGSAFLGGHLSFGQGVGVNQTAFEAWPTEWTPVLDERDIKEDEMTAASANGTAILLVKHQGELHALVDRCSHRGCSLHEGRLEGGRIICPCHGSTFRLDGRIVSGPATAPQPSLDVRVREGKVEVQGPPSLH